MRIHFSLRTLLVATLLCAAVFWWMFVPSEADRLREWIALHEDDISRFFDGEVSHEDMARDQFFRYWVDGYVDRGYKFTAIAADGTGGQYVVWERPNQKGPPPLAFFGSEGEHYAVTRSAWDFPLYIARTGSYYPDDEAEIDPRDLAHARECKAAAERYRQAARERYGNFPSMKTLQEGCEELTKELEKWVIECQNEPYKKK